MKNAEFIITMTKDNGAKIICLAKGNDYLSELAEREGVVYSMDALMKAMNRIQCDVIRKYNYTVWPSFNIITDIEK